MPAIADLVRAWTFEDLQRLPDADAAGNEIDRRRFELLDGSLVVSPAPAPRHEITVSRLGAALTRWVPSDYEVAGAIGIELANSYLVPDLVIVPSALYFSQSPTVDPAKVLLVVEVVSPGSRTMDRVTKPVQYAAAGIRSYWRVETEPDLTLTAYQLLPGEHSYIDVGTWGSGQTAEIDQPFTVRLEVDALAPPRPNRR